MVKNVKIFLLMLITAFCIYGQDEPAEEATTEESKPEAVAGGTDEDGNTRWEVSTSTITVDGKQWGLINVGVDVPIWKFGIFFDFELFVNDSGSIDKKGWDFDGGKAVMNSLLRKFRYIRFGRAGDPVFIKFGGLDNVTLGQGFIVNNFSNMLHYPGEKLFGLQLDLNDLSPVGITLEGVLADFKDFRRDGGVFGARLAFRPMKKLDVPILSKLQFGGTYATDLNQFAPARDWDLILKGQRYDRDEDGITDAHYIDSVYGNDTFFVQIKNKHIAANDYDTIVEHPDEWAKKAQDRVTMIGADITLPIISKEKLGLDIYGVWGTKLADEDAKNNDVSKSGWGIGAPGVSLRAGPVWARIEYRRVQGKFQPGFFDEYYLDERITRMTTTIPQADGSTKDTSFIYTKEKMIDDNATLNGVYGTLGGNIANVIILEGYYQYLIGKKDAGDSETPKDQRFEATLRIGDLLLSKIPKLNKVETFYKQTNISGNMFKKSLFTNYGFRVGIGATKGAGFLMETRFGYEDDGNGGLKSKKNFVAQAQMSF